MANINIFRVDRDKVSELNSSLSIYNCIDKGNKTINNVEFEYELYKSENEEKRKVSWEWIVNEFGEELDKIDSSPSGLLRLNLNNNIYLLSFGHSFFFAEKHCDKDFGFDFAKRIKYEQIKTTTLVVPNSRRNKMVNTYNNYTELDYDSGESFIKIKTKILDMELLKYISPVVEIGSSIKCNLKKEKIDSIISLLIEVENILEKKVINSIPLFNKVKNSRLIDILESSLVKNIDPKSLNVSLSELDIIGAIEIFNNSSDSYELRYKKHVRYIGELNINEIGLFIKDFNISSDEVLSIKVKCCNDGNSYTKVLHDCIDYIDDDNKCLLCNGVWYQYNNDYIESINESLKKIKCIYDDCYDFLESEYDRYFESKKKTNPKLTKNSLYKEKAFNMLREEKDGFTNYDRKNFVLDRHKFEPMDLYKDGTMYAVKIGNSSSKLDYAVDQSLVSLKLYEKGELENMPVIDTVGIWLLLERNEHIEDKNGQPDLSQLKMLALKARIVAWAREVLLSGKKPQIRINYTK